MKPLALAFAATLAASGLLWAAAPPPALPTAVKLTAQGGVTVMAPAWRVVRGDDAATVLEQAPDPAARRPFHVLMVAIEEGPPADAAIPWERVRDNVVAGATQAGRTLELTLGPGFDRVAGAEGRLMAGAYRGAGDTQVGLELVALAQGGRLVIVTLVSDALTDETRALLEAIAATVTFGG